MSLAERNALARLLEATEDGVSPRQGVAMSSEDLASCGLSAREVREFLDKLQPVARPDFELDLSIMQTADEVAARMYEAVPGSFE